MAPLHDDQPIDARSPVGVLVRAEPALVDERQTLRSVASVLTATHVGAALVARDETTLGIVSERDIARALAEGADPDVVWSADVMTEELATAGTHEEILRVAFHLLREGIRHIAVTDGDEVVGVVSARDVFAVLAQDAVESW